MKKLILCLACVVGLCGYGYAASAASDGAETTVSAEASNEYHITMRMVDYGDYFAVDLSCSHDWSGVIAYVYTNGQLYPIEFFSATSDVHYLDKPLGGIERLTKDGVNIPFTWSYY